MFFLFLLFLHLKKRLIPRELHSKTEFAPWLDPFICLAAG